MHPVGALDLLPKESAARLKAADEDTADLDGMLVNIAVSYGGRHELRDAVRSLLAEEARLAPRSRSWPRPWTSTTSPSTCTPRASPTRT